MARRFKKHLAPKTRRLPDQVLSVELIRKGTLDKVNKVWKKLISRLKSLKLTN